MKDARFKVYRNVKGKWLNEGTWYDALSLALAMFSLGKNSKEDAMSVRVQTVVKDVDGNDVTVKEVTI